MSRPSRQAPPALREEERHRVLVEWNDTAVPREAMWRAVGAVGPARASQGGGVGGAAGWRSVLQAVDAVAALRPGSLAVVDGDVEVTYGELVAASRRLGRHLATTGVERGDRVAVLLERSVEQVEALLAVMRCGAGYVPLDPEVPAARRRRLLEDAGARILVTRRELARGVATRREPTGEAAATRQEERVGGMVAREDPARPVERTRARAPGLVLLDEAEEEISRRAGEWVGREPVPEDLAYVIYTSGSTGRPKGVCVGHGALAGYVAGACRAHGIVEGDRVLQFASASFDVSLEEKLTALAAGAALVLRGTELEIGGFLQEVEERRVTVVTLPTGYWHEMVGYLQERGAALPESVRLVVVGGEAARWETMRGWYEAAARSRGGAAREQEPEASRGGESREETPEASRGGEPRGEAPEARREKAAHEGRAQGGGRARQGVVRLINAYGPTEATISATRADLTSPGEWFEREWSPPIGGPVENVRCHVVDGELRPLGVGEEGELAVGGAGLAQGYLGDPARTAEAFVPDPFGPPGAGGGRLYRTGDRARWRPDGTLEFLGRRDEQVKIRGYRVEPGEVEAELLRHPEVAEAVVAPRREGHGRRGLVAWVRLRSSAEAGVSAGRGGSAEPDRRYVEECRRVYEEWYGRMPRTADPAFNTVGWNSSFTGDPIPAVEMREWVDATVRRLATLRPDRVLEVGCGTGLILHRLAPGCSRYLATDFSPSVLRWLADSTAGMAQVELAHREADDFTDLPHGAFDTVVLNSVVQYFPDVDYLLRVLDGAVARVADGGAVFVGDVRSLPLLETFATSLSFARAPGSVTVADLRERIVRRVRGEQELVVAPAFFTALAGRCRRIRDVRVLVKRGRHANEMLRFRYDVVLRVGEPATAPGAAAPDPTVAGAPDPATHDARDPAAGRGPDRALDERPAGRRRRDPSWMEDGWDLDRLRRLLESDAPRDLRLGGIPSARLHRDNALRELVATADGGTTVTELRRRLEEVAPGGVDPEDLADLATARGYEIELDASGGDAGGAFDARLWRSGARGDPSGTPDRGKRGAGACADPGTVAVAGGRAGAAGAAPRDATTAALHDHVSDPLAWRRARHAAPRLREELRRALPAHMVPAAIVPVDAMPRTPAGKVDRAALPPPEGPRPALDTPWVGPSTRTEERILEIWQEVLGIEAIGVHDDFFELGGHSLLATRVVSRLQLRMDVVVPLRVLFDRPTVAALAAEVASRGAALAGGSGVARDAAAPPLVPVPREGDLPLSFAQERLWFLDRLEPTSTAYHTPAALRLRGPLDRRALQRALARLVRRHEALRTRFPDRGGRPRQVVEDEQAVELPLEDLGDDGADRQRLETRLARRLDELAAAPFDLSAGPLFRARLLRMGPREHVLALVLHHIVTDGWSQEILYRDLARGYGAALDGGARAARPARLADVHGEPAIRPADHAAWQRRYLRGARLERRLRYWRAQLDGLPALELPADRRRQGGARRRGGRQRLHLSAHSVEALRRLARSSGATLFMALTAAFQVLLGRLAGQEEFAIGTPVAGRDRPELEGLVGFFVNMLVLRADLRGEPTFRRVVERARETILAAHEHQGLPFEKLVEELHPERDTSRNPLFQVTVALQERPATRWRMGGVRPGGTGRDAGALAVTLEDLEIHEVRFDLELHAWTADGAVDGVLVFDRDLFDGATVRRMARQMETLVAALAADPDAPVSRHELLTPAQRHQVLVEWNDTPGPAAGSPRSAARRPVHRAVDACAAAAPGRTAVVAADGDLDHRALRDRAGALAGRLGKEGVGAGERVGVLMERSAAMVVALLGVLRSGASYVPLDPALPDERIRRMLAISGPALVVAAGERLARAPALWPGRILDVDAVAAATGPAAAGGTDADPDAEAYVLFTSGSTGRPKGVAVSHGALANHMAWMQDAYPLAPDDRVLQKTPFGFDASVWEFWAPLMSGGRLVMAPPGAHRDPAALVREVRERGITVLQVVPALLRLLLDQPGFARCGGLRRVFCGGEALPAELCRRFRDAGPPADLVNLYGPTEATIDSSSWPVRRVPETPTAPLGRPVRGVSLHVLDRHLRPVPPGVPGELHVGGAGLALGYVGRPGLTAERFVPDPHGPPGARLYRTGDRVRRLHDGTLEFLGRLDGQAKVRGFRVEPGEVESVLHEHPLVRQAAVVARRDDDGEVALHGYVDLADPPGKQDGEPQVDTATPPGRHDDDARVAEWEAFYEELHAADPPETGSGDRDDADPTFDTRGWVSSFTGEPLPAGEMREWLDHTVRRLEALSPRRVLEIGCGTGLVLFRLAPGRSAYWATDLSARALELVERHLPSPRLPRVRLLHRRADDLRGVPEGAFDTVVLNSLVQYFPGAGYLERVLAGAVDAAAEGGTIFVGDVRSLPYLEAFAAAVEWRRAGGAGPVDRLRRQAEARVRDEEELLLSPAFFTGLVGRLPRVAHVDVAPKAGRAHNELTRYRYDVTIFLDRPPEVVDALLLDWRGTGTPERLTRQMRRESVRAVVVRGVPDVRMTSSLEARQALFGGTASPGEGAPPLHELVELARGAGWTARAAWLEGRRGGYADGRFDLLLRRGAAGGPWAPRLPVEERHIAAGPVASDPLSARRRRGAVGALREHLRRQLPPYMIPATLSVLDALPLTVSGKVDRERLPEPAPSRAGGPRRGAPANELERTVAGLYGEILGVEDVGPADDFFVLGGHSLLATRLVWALRERLGVAVPVMAVFERPAVADLARALAGTRTRSSEDDDGIRRARRDVDLPLSFAQRRLWFLDQLDPGDTTYNVPVALRLDGRLDLPALRAALDGLAWRHEALRTRFPSRGGRPRQVVDPPAEVHLEVVDVGRRGRPVREWLQRSAEEPFDLARGPLFRARLLRLGPDESVLVLLLHHIVTDGWSQEILHRDLVDGYRAATGAASRPRRGPAALQYADFAVWQRRRLAGDGLARHLRYWSGRLEGTPALELPTDRRRRGGTRGRGRRQGLRLADRPVRELRRLGREAGATLFMTLTAAVQVFLGRLAGRQEFAIGTPVAGRDRPETREMVGFFVNTLVLRADLTGEPSFRGVVRRVRRATLEARQHQELPFERLVEELHPVREVARNPLVQVLFSLEERSRSRWELPGLSVELERIDLRRTAFDLELYLWPEGDGLGGEMVHDSGLFDATTGGRWARRFQEVVAALAAAPDRPVAELTSAAGEERHRVVIEWNDTGVSRERTWAGVGETGTGGPESARGARAVGRSVAGEAGGAWRSVAGEAGGAWRGVVGEAGGAWRSVVGAVDAIAERRPGSVAVVGGDAEDTYRELVDGSRRLAEHLVALGVERGDRVAVLLERSPRQVESLLAVMRCGAGYLPLDPEAPAARNRRLLEDAGARLVVTRREPAAGLAVASGVRCVLLDEEAGEIGARPGEWSGREPGRDDLAYVIYTSGSTGRPKGVCVGHGALASYVASACRAHGIGAEDRVLQFASASFDVSLEETLTALAAGAALVLRGRELGVEGFLRDLEERAVTVAALPTAYWQEVVGYLEERERGLPESLRLVVVGGEAVRWETMPGWYEVAARSRGGEDRGEAPGASREKAAHEGRVRGGSGAGQGVVRLINAYGPTEATISATRADLTSSGEWFERQWSPPIGRPVDNVRCHVVDEELRPLGVGEEGELVVGGEGLAQGYLGDPARTAEAFVPDPFGPPGAGGGRLYRTGDRARWRPDGTLEFLGRRDEQVKIRGYRVEPGEVEAELLRHPEVAEAVVAPRRDRQDSWRLVAWVRLRSRASAGARGQLRGAADDGTSGILHDHLRRSLATHMVPSAIVLVDAVPRTAAGKVDREALPAPGGVAASRAPRPGGRRPAEEILAGIWSDVLGCEPPGPDDDFFALGGHSLLAVRLVSRIREALDIELPLRRLFEEPRLRGLAAAVEELARGGGAPAAGPIPRRSRGVAPPPSFSQLRLWRLDRVDPGNAVYNVTDALALKGRLDVAALAAALDGIVRRHEPLRTTFQDGGRGGVEPRVRVAAEAGAELERVELVSGSPDRRRDRERRIVQAAAATPVDPSSGPLLRATLVRRGPDDHVLLLVAHHIAADGWSLEVIRRELGARYAQLVGAGVAPHPGADPARSAGGSGQLVGAGPAPGYGDYAAWQRRRLRGARLHRLVDRWRRDLAHVPRLELPLDGWSTRPAAYRVGEHGFRIPASTAAALERLGRSRGCTLFMTLLAAFAVVLHREAGQDDLAIGTPVAGRGRRELEDLVGEFVNILALRIRLHGDPTFAELLARVRRTTLDAYAHEEAPFELVLRATPTGEAPSPDPLFQAYLALLNAPLAELELPGLAVETAPVPPVPLGFDLSPERAADPRSRGLRLFLWKEGEELAGSLTFNREQLEARTAAGLVRAFVEVVDEIVEQPDRAVSGGRRATPGAPVAGFPGGAPSPGGD